MKRKTVIALALISCLLWASAFPTIKTLYRLLGVGDGIGIKIYLAGLRFFFAGIVILIYYWIRNKKRPYLPKGVYRWQVLLLGMIQTGIMYAFFYIGLYNSTGVKSSILSQVSIFIVVILSHFIYSNDYMHSGKVIGLALGLLGIIVVNINGIASGENLFEFSLTGEGFIIIASSLSAISTFMAKKISQKINPVLMTGWQMSFGGGMLLLVGSIIKTQDLTWAEPLSFILFIYSIIISAGAFTLWFVLLQKNKAGELSMIKFLIPIFGALLSAIFLSGETFTLSIVIALVLVAIGIYKCNRPRI